MKLRKYVKSDAETIVRWIADERSCYLWSADRYGHYPVSPQDMNALYSDADPDEFFPYTAYDETGLVGHLIMRYPTEDRKVLRFGFIIVDYLKRGRGYGAEMLREALKIAFSEYAVEKVTLGVFRDNTPAALCYLKVGFHPPVDPEAMKEREVEILGEPWVCCELEINKADILQE